MAKVLSEALTNVKPEMLSGLEDIQFGVEFEFLMQPQKLAAFMSKNNLGASKNIDESYSVNAANKILHKIGLNWDAKEDSSVLDENGNGEFGVEVVSPPLKGVDGLNQIVKFCSVFSKIGTVNDTCGLHVHVDANDWFSKKMPNKEAAEKITALLLRFKSFENLFDAQVASWRKKNNNDHAKASDSEEAILSAYNKVVNSPYFKDYKVDEVVKSLSSDRYRKLNIHSLLKYGTVEFRQLEGTLNADKVIRWIILCLSFLQSAKKITGTYQEILKSVANEIKSSKDVSQVIPPSVAPKRELSERIEAAKQAGTKLLKYVDTASDIDNLVLHIVEACYRRSFNHSTLPILKQMVEKLVALNGRGAEQGREWLATSAQGPDALFNKYMQPLIKEYMTAGRELNKNGLAQGVRVSGPQAEVIMPTFSSIVPPEIIIGFVKGFPNATHDPIFEKIQQDVRAEDLKAEISLQHAMFDASVTNYKMGIQPLWEISLRRLLQDKNAKDINKKISQAQGGKPDFKQVVPKAAQPYVLKQKG